MANYALKVAWLPESWCAVRGRSAKRLDHLIRVSSIVIYRVSSMPRLLLQFRASDGDEKVHKEKRFSRSG